MTLSLARLALPGRVGARLREEPHPTLALPCWVWTGRLNRNGYGRCWDGRREPVVHRLVWEALVGPIPKGLLLDHVCRRPSCVNPAHLEAVTVSVNTRRGEAVLYQKGRA